MKKLFKGYNSKEPFHLLSRHYVESAASVKLLFMCVFYVSLRNLHLLGKAVDSSNLMPPPTFAFIKYIPVNVIEFIIIMAPMVAFATFLIPRHRLLRVLTISIMLFVFAYKNSFGKKLHGELPWLYTGIVFSLIPTWNLKEIAVKRVKKHYHLLLYWFGLFVFLLPYTLSGLWKLGLGMVWQSLFEPKSFLSPDSMSYILSFYSLRIGDTGVWADYLIHHKWMGYILLLGGTYWEIIAILPLFRPHHWRLTAMLLITFHLLSYYTLNIWFGYQFALVTFFLFSVPLYQEPKSIHQLVYELPIIGNIYKLIQKKFLTLTR